MRVIVSLVLFLKITIAVNNMSYNNRIDVAQMLLYRVDKMRWLVK